MGRCWHSRSTPTTEEENAVVVTANSATQESTLDIQRSVDSLNNSKVASGSNDSPVSAHQMQSMLTTFMTAMQAENTKLASNLEPKLNELSEELDVKLTSVAESLNAKLNSVSDRLDAMINLMIANVTSEMRRENQQIRQEFSVQLQTEAQIITKEVDVVRNSTDKELTNCVQNFEGECSKINENVNNHKSQTETNMNGLRLVVNQNREELENKLDELTRKVRAVTSSIDECNGSIQRNKLNYQLDIQRLGVQIEEMRERVNGSLSNQAEPAVCASPQTSSTIRVIDVVRPTSQVPPSVPEISSCNSLRANCVTVNKTSECNEVRNSNTVAVPSIESVSARPEKYVDTSHYNELSLPRFTDSSQQVAVHSVRELDEYFSLRKTPEELCLPLVFHTISDPFVKQWMLTAYRQFKSYEDFKRAFTELLWDSTHQSEIQCRVYQDCYDYRLRESFSEHYTQYANMASMLSPAMSDQDLLSAMVTHYQPRIQACLISVNVKSTQEATAALTKLHLLENSREQYRTTRRDFEHQDQTRKTPLSHLVDSAGNRRPNDSVHVRHVRHDNRDRDQRGIPPRDPRANESQRNLFCAQGRPNDDADLQLNATATDFVPYSDLCCNDNRSQHVTQDGVRTGDLNM